MQPVIAKTDLGVCRCGVRLEAGDSVIFYPSGPFHAGCLPKDSTKAERTPTNSGGLLFDDPVRTEDYRVKEKVGAVRLAIHGETYSERRDKARLTKHLLAVFELMKDGQYRDTELIAAKLHIGATSAHARLRQLRSIGHRVPKRWVKGEDGARGCFEYALVVNRSLMGNEWESQRGTRAA